MDWILENFHFAIAFLAAFLWWLNKRREGKASAEEGPPPLVMSGPDLDDDDRSRRIQEEIRRKIGERRGQPPAGSPATAPMLLPEQQRPQAQPLELFQDPGPSVLEHHRLMDLQLREIEESSRKAAAIRARAAAVSVHAKRTPAPRAVSSRLIDDLRGAGNLRRAIVLREILGPPKGLQS